MSSARLGSETDSKLQIHPLVSEDALQHEGSKFPKEKKNLVMGPRWGLATKKDWPTDRRSQNNLNLNQRCLSYQHAENNFDHNNPLGLAWHVMWELQNRVVKTGDRKI
jgi:hypothetical protein